MFYKTRTIKTISLGVLLPLALVSQGCTGGSSSSGTSTTEDLFPSLAVASPLAFDDSEVSESLSLRHAGAGSARAYAAATIRIEQLLVGITNPTLCVFDPEQFLVDEQNADCFGPAVDYANHPDGAGGSGELPTGDLGLWAETDTTSGQACAAAQLNSKMASAQAKANTSLMGLASLICVANANSIALPDATTPEVDLTTQMNAVGITGTTFTEATMTFDSTTGGYAYHMDFAYDDGVLNHPIVVDMTHTPSGTEGAYDGQLSYMVDDEFTGGNCPTNEVTHNGSVRYSVSNFTNIDLEYRTGQFCGHGVDGRDSNDLVDPSDKYDATTNPDGWGNNFNIFLANYDSDNLDGSYAFNWQAGPADGNARIFNIQVEDEGSTAQAYYGYGADIEDTDGAIEGFICNWAGPGNDHTLLEQAQYQALAVDDDTATITATASNLVYAPTVSCEYDGLSTFTYDTDADGDLSDENAAIPVTHELLEGDDLDGDTESTIEEVIEDAGFTLPTF